MSPGPARPPRRPSEPSPGLPGRDLGCLLLGMLALWVTVSVLTTSLSSQPVPYSFVVAQARAGNLRRLQVEGENLVGAFKTPVTLPDPLSGEPIPPPMPARPAEPSAPVSPAPSSSSASPAPASPASPPVEVTHFRSVFPVTLGDPGFLPLLREQGVPVEARPTPVPWFSQLLVFGLPLVLVFLLVSQFLRRGADGRGGLFGFGRSQPRVYTSSRPGVTFEDVAGCDEAKQELLAEVEFLRRPEKFHALGARIPRGVLLVGPPGTGKTLLARAVAGEAGVPFFSLSASEFVEIFVGVGASRVRDLFAKAKAAAPAILFIDELDAVGRRRGAGMGTVNDEREQTLNQLLVEMDGFDERQDVIVLAATNRPDVLDRALLRPGRFDRQVEVPLPDRGGREAILRIHSRRLPLAADVDLGTVASATPGFSGADLANLCNEAALLAARGDRQQVTAADFQESQDKVVLGGVRSLLLKPHERRAIAWHEAGHTLVAWMTPQADPVHKVSIIPRGRTLGATEQVAGEDRYNYSRAWLDARLAVLLGGRAAEELVLGDTTTGAENDLLEATRLARRMVAVWGMGSLGPVSFRLDEAAGSWFDVTSRAYGEEMASRIDTDVQRLLADRAASARKLLEQHRELLGTLARALLSRETVDSDELLELLGARPGGGEQGGGGAFPGD